MTMIRKLAFAACVAFAPSALLAAPIAVATYDAIDYNGKRSVWTPGSNPTTHSKSFVTGNGASAVWSFNPGSKFLYTGSKARLKGTATNTGQSKLSFDFDLKFNVKKTGNTPYCQQKGAGSMHNCGTTDAGIDPSDWTYFSLISAVFKGAEGSHMEGVSYDVVSNAKHAPQAGEAANAMDNDGTGFSMWFTWTLSGQPTSPFADLYTFNPNGKGDFNVDLEIDPNGGGVVPLPAAGWMLLAGIGGLATAGRRRKKA